MVIGFVGLGNMGFPMARRMVGAGHDVLVCDKRDEVIEAAVAMGAQALSSPREVADQAETVFASLPSVRASVDVATGSDGVIAGSKATRYIDLSTIGSQTAQRISERLAENGIAMLDCPVSGGVRARPRHTGPDGVGPASRVRGCPRDHRNARPAPLRQREVGCRPDDEAREQPHGGDRFGGDGRSGRDGREGRPGRPGDDRRAQRRVGRHPCQPRQVSPCRSCRARSTTDSPPA